MAILINGVEILSHGRHCVNLTVDAEAGLQGSIGSRTIDRAIEGGRVGSK